MVTVRVRCRSGRSGGLWHRIDDAIRRLKLAKRSSSNRSLRLLWVASAKLAGVIVSGLGLGFIEKILEPITIITHPIKLFDATWAQVVAVGRSSSSSCSRKPAGLFPDKGSPPIKPTRPRHRSSPRRRFRQDIVLGIIMLVVEAGLVPLLYGTGLMSIEFVNKLGYIFAFPSGSGWT